VRGTSPSRLTSGDGNGRTVARTELASEPRSGRRTPAMNRLARLPSRSASSLLLRPANSTMVRRSSSVMPGSAAGGDRTMDVPGWSAGPTVIQRVPPCATSLRTSKPRGVAIEGQGCVRVVVREEARVNGDVHGGHASCGSVTRASRFLIGLVTCFAMHGDIPAVARAAWRREVLGGIPTRALKRVLSAQRCVPCRRRLPPAPPPSSAGMVGGCHSRAAVLSCGVQVILDQGASDEGYLWQVRRERLESSWCRVWLPRVMRFMG
jgi:hypothetical protein